MYLFSNKINKLYKMNKVNRREEISSNTLFWSDKTAKDKCDIYIRYILNEIYPLLLIFS